MCFSSLLLLQVLMWLQDIGLPSMTSFCSLGSSLPSLSAQCAEFEVFDETCSVSDATSVLAFLCACLHCVSMYRREIFTMKTFQCSPSTTKIK